MKLIYSLLLILLVPQCFALQLAWDLSSSPPVTSYKLYYGTQSRNYTGSILIANTNTITILNPTKAFFITLTAIDNNDNESDFSNEIQLEANSIQGNLVIYKVNK